MICQVYSAAVLMPASKALSPTIGLRSTIGSPSDVLAFRPQDTRPPTLPIATHLFTTTQAHPVGLGRYGLSEAFAHGFDGQPPQVVALIEPACGQETVAY